MRPSAALGRLGVVAALALAVGGCAVVRVDTYARRGTDFRQYRTYDWAPVDTFRTGDPRLDNNPFIQEHLKDSVDRRMASRGFEKVTAAPQLRIRYFANVSQQVEPAVVDDTYYESCEDCAPYVYEAGSIVLDFVDARTNRLVWRGWAEGSIDGLVNDQKLMEKRIDEAVAEILEKFPPRS